MRDVAKVTQGQDKKYFSQLCIHSGNNTLYLKNRDWKFWRCQNIFTQECECYVVPQEQKIIIFLFAEKLE